MTLRAYCDGALFAEQLGPGPACVVGLHGWGRSRHDLAPALAGFSALLVDLPGFGVSPDPPAAWGATEYATLVGKALDEAHIPGRVVVVGHSFGGRVATCLAAARPDLVGGLLLCGTPLIRLGPVQQPALGYRLVRFAHYHGMVSNTTMERVRRGKGSSDYRSSTGVMRDVLVRAVNETYDAELAALECPVAFLWGALDSAVPPKVAELAFHIVRRPVALSVLDGIGHDVHRDAAPVLADQVRKLLAEASS